MSPSSQERVFRKEYAVELLKIAAADLKPAEYLLEGFASGRIRGENYFFTVQQSLVKTLKAVLVHRELPVPLVHDLGALLAKVPRDCEPPFGYEISALSEFAAVRRYEEGALEWGMDEAIEARDLGRQALAWARGVLEIKD
ncbi:MAG: HEPN domain-containing protein [Spirochaetaceae bacterium]|nr:HEPN domain-containing protein [Spirochaetaceae bacterium]